MVKSPAVHIMYYDQCHLYILIDLYLCKKVKAITREIKELDTAKTNLTYSIKTLEKLSMLVRSIEDLS